MCNQLPLSSSDTKYFLMQGLKRSIFVMVFGFQTCQLYSPRCRERRLKMGLLCHWWAQQRWLDQKNHPQAQPSHTRLNHDRPKNAATTETQSDGLGPLLSWPRTSRAALVFRCAPLTHPISKPSGAARWPRHTLSQSPRTRRRIRKKKEKKKEGEKAISPERVQPPPRLVRESSRPRGAVARVRFLFFFYFWFSDRRRSFPAMLSVRCGGGGGGAAAVEEHGAVRHHRPLTPRQQQQLRTVVESLRLDPLEGSFRSCRSGTPGLLFSSLMIDRDSSRCSVIRLRRDFHFRRGVVNPSRFWWVSVDEGARLEIARQSYRAGDYKAALEHCNAVYRANPRLLENLLLLGAVYYQVLLGILGAVVIRCWRGCYTDLGIWFSYESLTCASRRTRRLLQSSRIAQSASTALRMPGGWDHFILEKCRP